MHLGAVLSTGESLCTEYKEFCLKKCIYDYYTRDEINTIIETGVLNDDFNEIIYDTLQKYFVYYLPKYASGFSNCESEGTLYIGVNDFGEVTGIPLIGTINTEIIETYLKDIIENYLRGVGINKYAYTNSIDISIEKLDINMMLLYDESKEIMKKMRSDYDNYKYEYNQYLANRYTWLNILLTYTCKLTQLLKNKNDELCTYIKNTCTNPQIASKAIKSAQDAIDTMINFEVILQYKDTESHYIYWLLCFKDNIISNHLAQRPRQPLIPRTSNSAYTLITHISDLRHLFLTKNKNINYYLIKIKLPSNISKGCYLEYKHPYKNRWDAKQRLVHKALGPCLLGI